MDFKISVILLHLFTTTLPISRHATSSLHVLATNNVNTQNHIDTKHNETFHRLLHQQPQQQTHEQIRQHSIITTTTTIATDRCSEPYCLHVLNKSIEINSDEHLNIIRKDSFTTTNIDNYQMENRFLDRSSVIYGLLKLAKKNNFNEQCFSNLQQIYNGIQHKELWAMKVLDSSGIPEPGFVLGQNFWLGSMKGCEGVRKPHRITLSNRFQRHMHANLLKATAPFDIDYRVIYVEHKSPWQVQVEFLLEAKKILHIGLCLPTSCTNDEIANVTQEYFDRDLLDARRIFEHQSNVLEVKDLNVKTDFLQKKSVQLICGFVLFTVIMFLASYVYEESTEKHMPAVSSDNSGQTIAGNNNTETLINPPDVILGCSKVVVEEKSFFERMAQCFSLRQNLKSLINVNAPPNAVSVVDGLKSIGCFMILLFHMNWYMHYTAHNPSMIFAYGEQASWQWVTALPIIVDVFFTISGLLLSYNFLRNQTKVYEIKTNSLWQNLKLFGKQILHRYIRLTPLYLVVVGLTEIATTYMVETSPFWINDRYDVICHKHWWRNVLYVQNLFHVNDLCLSWTWSLACEMQFFIICTALLFIYAKNENLAKNICIGLFGFFTAITLYVAVTTKFTPAYDVIHHLGTELYISPWTRIIPYLVGVAAGWYLYTSNGVLALEKKTIKTLWTVATTFVILSHISTINRDISHIYAAPLITCIRIWYPTSVAWMIIASCTGHGGLFSKILNFSGFVHVNKLTYGIYLLNPAVISVIYGAKDHSTHVDPITMAVMSCGVCVIVYIMAFAFSLLFEMPYTRLSSQLWKGSNKRKKKVL